MGLSQQKEFVHQIQSSGVLVVLSQAWIEELYHQVLERNLLGEAGYWESPEEHSVPLITMLTGSKRTTRAWCTVCHYSHVYYRLYLKNDVARIFITVKMNFSFYEFYIIVFIILYFYSKRHWLFLLSWDKDFKEWPYYLSLIFFLSALFSSCLAT